MTGPLFGSEQLAATFTTLGNPTTPILGMTEQQLLQQILVAVANRSGGGGGGGGGGTVTDVSVVTANGVSGSVATSTTTPAITLTLGNITPSRVTVATAGAVSVSDLAMTGAIFTGGSATTTKPKVLIEPTGTTSTNWSTAGTALGINVATGFTGNLLDLQLNGVDRLKVTNAGGLVGGGAAFGNFDITVPSGSNRTVQIVADGAGSVILNGTSVQTFTGVRLRTTAGIGVPLNGLYRFSTTNGDDDGSNGASITANGSGANIGLTLNRTGTGNIILPSLPTSDPGVSGALYKTAGAVMQSA